MTGRLEGRLIGLGVTGSIAAYKALELLRALRAEGADVAVMVTPAATRFVGPLSFAALSRHPVETDVLALLPDGRIGHILIGDSADAIVVAPATAHWIGTMANGLSGDVGADRLVNALAAGRLYGTPAVVVDFGTATTLDCVAADGAYVGGAIAPGLELGLEALSARTAKLPRIELRAPNRAIARDTVSAMQSGTIFGYQALTTGLLRRVRGELADANGVGPDEVHAILTGGLSAAPWARSIEGVEAIDPELTLKGLAILHAEVGGGEPLELGLR